MPVNTYSEGQILTAGSINENSTLPYFVGSITKSSSGLEIYNSTFLNGIGSPYYFFPTTGSYKGVISFGTPLFCLGSTFYNGIIPSYVPTTTQLNYYSGATTVAIFNTTQTNRLKNVQLAKTGSISSVTGSEYCVDGIIPGSTIVTGFVCNYTSGTNPSILFNFDMSTTYSVKSFTAGISLPGYASAGNRQYLWCWSTDGATYISGTTNTVANGTPADYTTSIFIPAGSTVRYFRLQTVCNTNVVGSNGSIWEVVAWD